MTMFFQKNEMVLMLVMMTIFSLITPSLSQCYGTTRPEPVVFYVGGSLTAPSPIWEDPFLLHPDNKIIQAIDICFNKDILNGVRFFHSLFPILDHSTDTLGPYRGAECGAKATRHSFADGLNEYFLGVEGRSGDKIDKLKFFSNKREYGTVDGQAGSPFWVVINYNNRRHINGFAGPKNSIDNFGVSYLPSIPPCQLKTNSKSIFAGVGPAGGNSGQAFTLSFSYVQSVKLCKVKGGNNAFSGIELTYANSGSTASAGSTTPRECTTRKIAVGERIVGIYGKAGDLVDSLGLIILDGRGNLIVEPEYGATDSKATPFKLIIETKRINVSGLFGTAGASIDSVGLITSYTNGAK